MHPGKSCKGDAVIFRREADVAAMRWECGSLPVCLQFKDVPGHYAVAFPESPSAADSATGDASRALRSAARSVDKVTRELWGVTLLRESTVAGAHRAMRPLGLPQCCSICLFEPGFPEAVSSQRCHLQRPSFYVHSLHRDFVKTLWIRP